MDDIKNIMIKSIVSNTDNQNVINYLSNCINAENNDFEEDDDLTNFYDSYNRAIIRDEKKYGDNIYCLIEEIIKRKVNLYKDQIEDKYFKEITRFLKFYVIAYCIVHSGKEYTLKDIAEDLFEDMNSDLDEDEDECYDDNYEVNIEDIPGFKSFYNKLCRDYAKSDIFETMKKDAGIQISKRENYKGKKILNHSLREIKELNTMWRREKNEVLEAEKAHKKIRNNIMYKMTNKNFKELHDYFNNNIISDDEEYKNIYFYKLERRLGHEFKKCIFKNANKLKSNDRKFLYSVLAIKFVAPITILTIREDLTNKLLKIVMENKENEHEMSCFLEEIYMIHELIHDSVEYIAKYINVGLKRKPEFNERDIEEFKKIYNVNNGIKDFGNDYKINKDYTKDDVQAYAVAIQFKRIYESNKVKQFVNKANK